MNLYVPGTARWWWIWDHWKIKETLWHFFDYHNVVSYFLFIEANKTKILILSILIMFLVFCRVLERCS